MRNKERIATANHLCQIITLVRQGKTRSEIIAIFWVGSGMGVLTNIDPDILGGREVLLRYKGQHKVEHNFSVLKMPLLASTLFLEKPERIEAMMTLLYFSVLMHGILQVISRTRIAACEEPPRLGTENKPLIRPKSETMLSILALFEIISKGDAVSMRSKMPEMRTQLNLLLFLVDFNSTVI